MTLKDICTSLGLSKKLAEAGVSQEGGVGYWSAPETCIAGECERKYEVVPPYFKPEFKGKWRDYRAFCFNELWDLLPKEVNFCGSKTLLYFLELHKYRNYNSVGYFRHSIQEREFLEDSMKSKQNKQPQEIVGELLLWCIKNGYCDPKEG